MITLYSYFRSSAAYRVRIGLNLKNVDYKIVPVNLLEGEQNMEDYRGVNPMQSVPTLDHDGFLLTQSLAILNYIDNVFPTPPLAEGNFQELSYVRQIALSIATDIHPLNNTRVLKHLGVQFNADDKARSDWYAHWATFGMDGVEALLCERGWHGDFAMGNSVSVADLCIVPQMYNMRRYKLSLENYPICRKIEKNCMALKAFQDAAPEMQQDAPAGLEPVHGPQFNGRDAA